MVVVGVGEGRGEVFPPILGFRECVGGGFERRIACGAGEEVFRRDVDVNLNSTS